MLANKNVFGDKYILVPLGESHGNARRHMANLSVMHAVEGIGIS